MADLYYKADSTYVYFTNEAKSDYTLWVPGTIVCTNLIVKIEPVDFKFILPENCNKLFMNSKNSTFYYSDS